MTAIDHPSSEPLVLTANDRQEMRERLQHDAYVIIELAERLGRDDLGPSDLVDHGGPGQQIDPISGRVLRRRLIRAVLRHTRRAARLAELLLDLPREPDTAVWQDRMVAPAARCATGMTAMQGANDASDRQPPRDLRVVSTADRVR